ncbi:MAG: class I SAM-dependent methyltransferase [Micromonosporaceae bacterium]|nr:class I SAM-dependent methyltransferase [Micromonosporaceae bacterium]
MPTVPAEEPEAHRPEAHQHRDVAESFGTDPERYDRTRPRYPAAALERILAASPGPDVLDVGCGTGILARQLQAVRMKVLGIEPDVRMAEFARETGVPVEVATFEAWEPAGRRYDAVVAGQAWHWVDPDAGAAKAARVLRPGGLLAPFWHVFQLPSDVAGAFATVYRRVVPDSPFDLRAMASALDTYQAMCGRVAEGIRDTGSFGEPQQWRFDWERPYTRDEWLEQMPTLGPLTRLPEVQRAEILAGVGEAIDAMGGGFTMPYATMAVAAVRNGT